MSRCERGVAGCAGLLLRSRPRPLAGSPAFRFAALACRHHLRPLGRTRLGGSCGLYGNGMMFTRSLFEGRRWTGHLVEDAELQNELLLDGHLVTYVPDAVVWAEMPHTLVAGDQPERTMGTRSDRDGAAVRADASRRARLCSRAPGRARRRRLRPSRAAALGACGDAARGSRRARGRRGRRSSRVTRRARRRRCLDRGRRGARLRRPRFGWRALQPATRRCCRLRRSRRGRSRSGPSAMRPDRAVDWTRTERNVETAE